jgi:hypothetical protein
MPIVVDEVRSALAGILDAPDPPHARRGAEHGARVERGDGDGDREELELVVHGRRWGRRHERLDGRRESD